MRVLIVEDDRFYAQFISELLGDHDVTPIVVPSAEQALAVDVQTYDAAIIDIMLPNDPDLSGITPEESRGGFCAGIAVARRLLQKNSGLRIVFLSSDVSNREAESRLTQDLSPCFARVTQARRCPMYCVNWAMLRSGERTPLAFIVHGHDSKMLLELKNYIQNTLKWQEPIVLREQPNSGKTLIEKFEDFTRRVDFVFVLLTPEDKVVSSGSNEEKRRSRQNVVFELGFFYGAFGRRSGRILLLDAGPGPAASDIDGIVWIDIESGIDAAGEEIRKEVGGVDRVTSRSMMMLARRSPGHQQA